VTPGGQFSQEVRDQVFWREEGACVLCGSGQSPNWQHRKARGSGGTRKVMTAANGLLLCHLCHMAVEASPADARVLGYRVDQYADPAVVPVWRARFGSWALLTVGGLAVFAEWPDEGVVCTEVEARTVAERLTNRAGTARFVP